MNSGELALCLACESPVAWNALACPKCGARNPLRLEGHTTFHIPLPDGRVVYMRCEDKELQEHGGDRFAVWVETAKFLRLWDAKQHRDCSLEDYSNREKLLEAEKGFSHGRINPVPLSKIDHMAHPASGKLRVSHVTRIVWLILNHASSFPVLCESDDVSTLVRLCGKISE